MNFQIIRDEYYNGIQERVNKYFPEFRSVFNERDETYPMLGELATFITDNASNEKLIIATIAFVNEAIENGGNETEDAVVLQLFQKFYEYPELTVKVRKLLNLKSMTLFDKYHAL